MKNRETENPRATENTDFESRLIAHYLRGAINLSRAAELLHIPWFDLPTRFFAWIYRFAPPPTNIVWVKFLVM